MSHSLNYKMLKRRELFKQMWNDNETSEAIAAVFTVSKATVNSFGKSLGLDRRYLGAQYRSFPELTEDEIKEECKKIRANWDAETEFNRRVQRSSECFMTRLSWSNVGFVDAGEPEAIAPFDGKKMMNLIKESGQSHGPRSSFTVCGRKVS